MRAVQSRDLRMEKHLIQLPIPQDYTTTKVQLVLCQQNFDFKKSQEAAYGTHFPCEQKS